MNQLIMLMYYWNHLYLFLQLTFIYCYSLLKGEKQEEICVCGN